LQKLLQRARAPVCRRLRCRRRQWGGAAMARAGLCGWPMKWAHRQVRYVARFGTVSFAARTKTAASSSPLGASTRAARCSGGGCSGGGCCGGGRWCGTRGGARRSVAAALPRPPSPMRAVSAPTPPAPTPASSGGCGGAGGGGWCGPRGGASCGTTTATFRPSPPLSASSSPMHRCASPPPSSWISLATPPRRILQGVGQLLQGGLT